MADSKVDSTESDTMTFAQEEGWEEKCVDSGPLGTGEQRQSKLPWRKRNVFSWLFLL